MWFEYERFSFLYLEFHFALCLAWCVMINTAVLECCTEYSLDLLHIDIICGLNLLVLYSSQRIISQAL